MAQTLTQVGLINFDRPAYRPNISWSDRAFCLSYWTEAGLEKEKLLQEVIDFLIPYKYFIAVDRGWSGWDLEIYWGIWSKVEVKVCAENHGGNKRLLRMRCALRMSQLATMAMAGYSLLTVVALILGMPELATVAVIAGVLNAAVILYQNFGLGRIIYQVLLIVTKKMHLLPIHTTDAQAMTPSAILHS
ncbi:hypothetical protein WA1_46775 [Scytonema hofmannii PCC 7110]|uniref:Uncharacterized protein n=1 Tax=Scytonema hofmannii PCC 7110 TaxID=128403 RepID=A0A139WXH6_9CYAN|nr:hypothetical protein [Scytonema hofmannii]KYC37141.1 hypothetical protein WA1_46775 [Scytonema hofmannii PCC 7110]